VSTGRCLPADVAVVGAQTKADLESCEELGALRALTIS
jgi:hypothetical protein